MGLPPSSATLLGLIPGFWTPGVGSSVSSETKKIVRATVVKRITTAAAATMLTITDNVSFFIDHLLRPMLGAAEEGTFLLRVQGERMK